LADTGAEDNYVSEAYCRANGITFTTPDTPERVELGDDTSSVNVSGYCLATIKIQGFRKRLRFKVINLNTAFAAVIGWPTLERWAAEIHCKSAEIRIKGPKRTFVLQGLQGRKPANAATKPKQGRLLTLRQVEREVQRGNTIFLGFVRHPTGDPPPQGVDHEVDHMEDGVGPSEIKDAPEDVRDLLMDFQDVF
jgi:hypothetical protein